MTGAARLEAGIVLQVGWVVLQEKRCAVGASFFIRMLNFIPKRRN